ncbi:MAG: FapA family protein [Desulfobacula sp.]|nr:FapA family protein [Desulfobacula sp.]
MIDPKKIQERADILETNLFKSISKQTDPSRIQVKIDRTNFSDQIISKALLQLMPRFNIKPSLFILGLRDLFQKKIAPDENEVFHTQINDWEDTLHDDDKSINRSLEIILSKKTLQVTVTALSPVPCIDGRIDKSYFNHEQSAGKLLKDGIINFKEINKYPIVNAGDKLFHIGHEKQGKPGISFDGKLLPVREAVPLMINIGPGVERIDDVDDGTFDSRGYHLQAQTTGVVLLDWDDDGIVRGIQIDDEVEIKRLDYSVGNIGTQYTCPISARIGIICNVFKIRINGRVQVDISEGAEIITNNEAQISLVQSGSNISALKDIEISSSSGSNISSEEGCITINNELIDSNISAPDIVFKKSRGLLTNNLIKTNKLFFNGLYLSGENIIHFGCSLFSQKETLLKDMGTVKNKIQELSSNEKLLLGQLQLELKRMAKLTIADSSLARHIKPVIIATNTMDYGTIYREMDLIQKRNNTKPVFNTRKLFETLEKIPVSIEVYKQKQNTIARQIEDVDRRMGFLKLEIEGILRKAATIKIFCGNIEGKDASKPDFMLESDGGDSKYIKVTGSYSHQKGFEFVQ